MKLLDACELIVDCPHSTAKDEGSGYPLIRTPNVGRGRLKFDGVHRVSYETYCARNERAVPQTDDLILAREAPVGNVAIIKNGQQVCLGQRTVLIRPNKKIVESNFLVYYLLSPQMQHALLSTANGATVSHLNMADIRKLEINLPDLEVQKKIGNLLSIIEDKIENNNEINDNLLQQAQALFESWFIDYEPFGGIIPEDWNDISIYDLADYINGAAFKKNEYADTGLPIIKIAELKNGITDSTQYCCVKKDSKYYIDDRDILFSWSGNPDTSIDTFIWSKGLAILNQHTFRVVSKYDAPAFTFFLLKYLKPVFTHIASNKQTTGLGHVTVTDLKRLQFRTNANVITEFNSLVMPIFELIYSNYKEIQQLLALRDTLLPKLMSGDIDVSSLDI